MKFSKTTRYGRDWYEIESPNVSGYPWFLLIKQGGYCVEFAGSDNQGDIREFCYEPSSPDDQARIDNAKLFTVISWAHKDIKESIAASETE